MSNLNDIAGTTGQQPETREAEEPAAGEPEAEVQEMLARLDEKNDALEYITKEGLHKKIEDLT